MRGALRAALPAIVIVAAWELAGRLRLVGDGALPALSSILTRLVDERAEYPPHLGATLRAALIGFVIGNTVAIVLGCVFARVPVVERLLRGIGVTLFAVPLIAIVPVLLIAFSGNTPRIVVAALAVYYPTMVATVHGLGRVDSRLVDLVAASGGGEGAVFRFVRLRAALPSIVAGLRTAAPAALLGALLAEFGGGVRWGLGSFLLGSLGRAEPTRIWGIGLVATAVAALGYAVFSLLGARLSRDVLGPSTALDGTGADGPTEPLARRFVLGLVSGGVVLGLWALLVAWLNVSPIVVKTPLGVLRYLTTGPRGEAARERLLDALAQTLPIALLGLACGLLAALALALVSWLTPAVGRALLPVALVTQTMPLPALTPIIVLVFGRSTAAMVAVTVSVTFFPSFVIVAQGLQLVPPGPAAVVGAYGGGPWTTLRFVALPNAVGYLVTAARLAAPRALLGVMIAEYLATGTGIGNLLNEARGRLEYGMIWSVATVAVLVAVSLTWLVSRAERQVWRTLGRR